MMSGSNTNLQQHNQDNNDKSRRAIKHLLLSSPPGQFDVILTDLNTILLHQQQGQDQQSVVAVGGVGGGSGGVSSLLNSEWIQSIRMEYESRTGRHILSTTTTDEEEEMNNEESTTSSLKQSLMMSAMKEYLTTFYSSKDVNANVQVIMEDEDKDKMTILLYAERIQLSQYHAGSWLSKYQLDMSTNISESMMSITGGKVVLRAHAFENGNVQMKSVTDIPVQQVSLLPTTVDNTDTTTTAIVAKKVVEEITKLEEQHVLEPLHQVYNSMSNEYLKQFRRIMPVTRTKFDWNVDSFMMKKNTLRIGNSSDDDDDGGNGQQTEE